MDRVSALTTVAIFATFLVVGAQGMSDGQAMRMPTEVRLAKTDRIAPIEVAGGMLDDSEGEWMLDCYEAFGPDAVSPNGGELNTCLQ